MTTTENITPEFLNRFSLPEQRALIAHTEDANRLPAFSGEAVLAAAKGEARWADVFGFSSEDIDTWIQAASELALRGQNKESIKVWSLLSELDPHNPRIHIGKGILALEEDDDIEAAACFTAAIVCAGGDLGAYAGRAIALMRLNEKEAASADIEQAVALDPEGIEDLTVALAKALLEQGALQNRH